MLSGVNVMQEAHNQKLAQNKKTKSLVQKVLIQIKTISENDRSLFIFSEQNTIRGFARLISDSIVFEWLVLATIIANCVSMALEEHLPNNDKTKLSIRLDSTEKYFLGIFTVEAILKIIAMGFVLNSNSYLRSFWSILDFTVVVTGFMTIFITSASFDLRILRCGRVLRPLKLVSGIPSLQVVMHSILKAMAPLLQIALLVLFAIVIFAIIGLEFYSGIFHSTCHNTTTMEKFIVPREGELRPCSLSNDNAFTCSNEAFLKTEDIECIENSWHGPNYGITSFDNIGYAMLTVFQCITMEGWTTILYYTNDAMGNHFNWIYFVPLIVIGSFFMLNLVLGVISGEFAKEREKVESRRHFLRLRKQNEVENELETYIDWICKAEEQILAQENTTDYERNIILETRRQYAATKMRPGIRKEISEDKVYLVEEEIDIDDEFKKRSKNKIRPNKNQRAKRKKKPHLRLRMRKIIKTQTFYWTVIILVFLNTLCIAVEHNNQPDWLTHFLHYTEIVFLALFLVEMSIKIYCLGPRYYFNSTFNKFDSIVIIGSIFETIFTSYYPDQSFGISVIRSLRLLRIFKVTRYWQSLRNLVISLINSIQSIISLLFLLFLFTLIFALLGMQLFGGEWNFEENTPPNNFNTFPVALLTVFQILTGEDWNEIMYFGIRSKGGAYSWGALSSLYFIILVLFGNYTLLNVFLAIAVDNLNMAREMTFQQEEAEEMAKEQFENNMTAQETTVNLMDTFFGDIKTNDNSKNKTPENIQNDVSSKAPKNNEEFAVTSFIQYKNAEENKEHQTANIEDMLKYTNKVDLDYIPGLDDELKIIIPASFETSLAQACKEKSTASKNPIALMKTPDEILRQIDAINAIENRQPVIEEKEIKISINDDSNENNGPKKMPPYSSMFILSEENCFRKAIYSIISLKYFETFIMIVISCSSIALATEDPVDEKNNRNLILEYLDYGFTSIFTVEMLFRLIAMGVICHPGSYFRDIWNILDATVVICALISFIFSGSATASKNLNTIKSLRVLRVLRPLKTINRVPKLKAVFNCVINSLKNVFNILMVYILFNIIFAVIAVQLFKGKFYYCNDLSKSTKTECQGQFFTTNKESLNVIIETRKWQRYEFHYDNVFYAILTLFTVQTGEGWPAILEHSINSNKVDHGPIPGNRLEVGFFYIIYFILFPFFFVNIFVALIIITFQEQGQQDLAECDINKNQKTCIEFAMHAEPVKRYMPEDKHSFRYKVWKFVESAGFEIFILMLITVNTIILMMKWPNQSKDVKNVLKYMNIVFTGFFSIESFLKIIAFGPKNYFSDSWNIFDFVTVVGSIIDALVSEYSEITLQTNKNASKYAYLFENTIEKKHTTVNLGFLRLFRAARLVKLLRQGQTIRMLLYTFLQSFKALPYVCLLIAMFFFIYAIIGMQVFGNIKLDSAGAINRNNNFQNFLQALLLLFRCATGENWQEIMRSCLSGAQCEPIPADKYEMLHNPKFKHDYLLVNENKKCGVDFAYAYFCSFVFLSTFLMLNLFVAVIMDNFDYLTRDSSILGAHHLDEFIRAWGEIDPIGTGKAHYKDVYKMLLNMEPPVGFGARCPKIIAYRKLIRMNMPLDENEMVHFTTTLFALIRESLGIKCYPEVDERLMDQSDNELRTIINTLWPIDSVKKLDLLVPPKSMLHGTKEKRCLTVGKIYAGLLALENYRSYKTTLAKMDDPIRSTFFIQLMNMVRQNTVQSPSNNSEIHDANIIKSNEFSKSTNAEYV